MTVVIFLGFAAGVKTMLRTAAEMSGPISVDSSFGSPGPGPRTSRSTFSISERAVVSPTR